MAFTGDEDHSITLDEAVEMTKRYRYSVASGAILAGFFGKSTLQKMLDQEDCVGIRIYHALKANNDLTFVLVGADGNEHDIYHGEIAEYAVQCPPFCDLNSPLLS
jgi:hypothetical protein